MTPEQNAIDIARLEQKLEDHVRNATGHQSVADLYDRINTMEKALLQIRWTGYGIAVLLLFMSTGLDLGAVFKLLGVL